MPKRSVRKSAGKSPQPTSAPLFYPLHALLETIRVIKTYEDALCTLLHAIQTGATTAAHPSESAVEHELRDLLEEMPSTAYLDEMHAVRSLLGAVPVDTKPARPPVETSATTQKRPGKAAGPLKAIRAPDAVKETQKTKRSKAVQSPKKSLRTKAS